MAKLTRNLWKIRALLYKDNIAQYLTEFQDLNNVVRLGGQAIKEMVARAVPRKINRINLFPPRYGSLRRFRIHHRNTGYRFNLQISYITIKVSTGKP